MNGWCTAARSSSSSNRLHYHPCGKCWYRLACQLRNRYEFVTKVSRSSSSEEMGCEHRVRIAHLDGTLFFLRNGALVCGKPAAFVGRPQAPSVVIFIARSVLGPNGTRFTSARRRKMKVPFHCHSYGMVGFVKELVDEQGAADIAMGSKAGWRKSKFKNILITPGIVIVAKAASTLTAFPNEIRAKN